MDLREKLAELGMLPIPSADFEVDARRLISDLAAIWQAEAESRHGSSATKAAQVSAWLGHGIASGAVAEFRNSPGSSLESEFGERILWWPRGKPDSRLISIVSSRIGRKFHEHPRLFETLRLAAATLQDGDSLVTSPGTAMHRFVPRLAELLGIPRVEVRISSPRLMAGNWFEWLVKEATPAADQYRYPVFISPSLTSIVAESDQNRIPERDLAVSLLSDQTWVLTLRRHGHVRSLLSRGLSESTFPPGTVRLLCGEGLVTEAQARTLQDFGAVTWYLSATGNLPEHKPIAQPQAHRIVAALSRHVELDAENWIWLTHCTRESNDAWPDETEANFVDEVLLSEAAERPPLAALLRILSQEKLLASGVGIRGQYPVVCFSARRLEALLQNRKWQRHRTRWDFEPFGICIRQEFLRQVHAKPVTYGDDLAWEQLSEADRPWFQKRSSQIGDETIDWSAEQEWRVRGDVDLSQIGPDDAFVFVPTEAAAIEVRGVSRWPVTVVQPDER